MFRVAIIVTGIEERLTANFCCAKCRGKSAVARTVSLSRSLGDLLRLPSQPYVLVTCALCGYTEIYHTAAYALSAEPAVEPPPPLPDKAP